MSPRPIPTPARAPWRLERERSAARALAALVRSQARAMAAWARCGEAVSLRVHRLRRAGKKLRALARLLRPAIGERAYRPWNRAVRDAARRVASARDADVLVAAWERLTGGDAGQGVVAFEVRERLRRGVAREQAALERRRALPRIAREIGDGAPRWVASIPAGLDLAALRAGVAASYRRARSQSAAARRSPTTEALHELRKRAKVVLAHVELLAPDRGPGAARGRLLAERLRRLTDLLGADHDLAVLLAYLAREGFPPIRGVRRARAERKALVRRALAVAADTYVESPQDFARALVPQDR